VILIPSDDGRERFLRRRRQTATVARPEGLGGLTS
jgi:hypothetical protein